MITFPKAGFEHTNEKRSEEDYINLARRVVGVADLPVKINGISKWDVKGEIASSYGKSRVLCLGDAVHRHPPLVSMSTLVPVRTMSNVFKNGLGSNTCIQDAFNLAWKLAYVLKGWLF